MKNLLLYLIFILSVCSSTPVFGQNSSHDLVIYGSTSAGIAAAIQSSRMGKSVLLIEPTNHIGGLTTGGLGATDIGNKQAIGGISREFYQNIKAFYEYPNHWKWQKRSEYFKPNSNIPSKEGEDAMWTFEPSAAMKVYEQMMASEDIELVTEKRLDREKGVELNKNRIVSITMESGERYQGKMFIDATYEGDLMAAAGVSYMVGREANTEFGETLNGVQANYYNITLKGKVSRNAVHHNFIPGVDPFIEKGNPSSGLIPFIMEGQNEIFWFSLAIGTIGGLMFSLLGVFLALPVFLWKKKS